MLAEPGAGWLIRPGATNVIDLSYPIQPTGMSLHPVYPPIIITPDVPSREGILTFPATVDKETGYPVNGFYSRVIHQMMEGHGTHVEGSSHGFGELGRNIDDYPLSRYIGPLAVLNVVEQTRANPDYEITVEDILSWEARNGTIPQGAAVVLHSGRGGYWGIDQAYFGKDERGRDHYPGFGVESATLLVGERGISMLGTDLPTVDSPGQKGRMKTARPFASTPVRDVVQRPPNDVIILEYLANLEKVPESGALVIAAPVNLADGAQGMARVLAVLPTLVTRRT
ncbi:MAG: cyclase family protein [Chloroflexota bacterium]|nr:MAG: cyclase family protein [Chloroflexota bacterium]